MKAFLAAAAIVLALAIAADISFNKADITLSILYCIFGRKLII